ncbi:TonB-dependent receptor plug domain-containing protein [Massilia horti]|uniref:TonB-dependent receptor n=1 Tax=Massilia horti TaxID=2562153 RepID=A0A4Y9T8M7_9BURK|nr:TonB-dependent receptor [Massilia horti]TFW34225.1 TonB-dependent receptor [Massilia horti]
MIEKVLSRSIRVICLGGIAFGMHAANAQDQQDQPMARVEVTGSRLASPNAESASPLQVLTAADIAASGATNLQQLLLNNPTMGTPTISRTNSAFQTSSVGVATIDLRNLGTSRTLVLVNGRRFVAGIPGESAVDLNSIPTDFIERVELFTGGASATYGSDAVAGVVNIITKKNFNGLIADAQGGKSSKGDDLKRKLALTWGTSNDDGFIMAHLGYSRQGQVWSRDRAASAIDQYSLMALDTEDPADAFTPYRPYYSSYAPQGRFTWAKGKDFTYDKSGNIIPWDTNGDNGPATGFNRSYYRSIAVPTERYLLATNGELKLGEKHRAFFEGTYASTSVGATIEPFALASTDIFKATSGWVPAGTMVNGVVVKNPYVPQYLWDRAVDNDGDGIRDYSFTRRMSEVGTRSQKVDRDTFRLATGVKGSFDLLKEWNYEVYGAFGQTKEAQNSTGQVNTLNFRYALQAIPDGNGGVMCADANARKQGCVPINIFGYNAVTPEALKYIDAPGALATKTTQKLVGGTIDGEPFAVPAGNVGVAAGFEWRKEFSSSIPDALTQAGLNAGNATPPTEGEFTVKEVFVETNVPLLKDLPFVKALDLKAAFRHGEYSTIGTANSWNGGFEWAVNSDIKFRGTRSLSTRAPNINELFQAPSQDFPSGLTDPCAGVTATSTGTYDALCRAAPGVMANINANGKFTLNQSDVQGISGYNRGNPHLGAEKGRSSTIGLVYTPRSIPVLSKVTFTADYFNIKIADAIVSTPRSYALKSCYDGSNPAMCQFITRRATNQGANSAGSLQYIDTAVSNSGGKATEGIDITASWADRVGPGRLSTHLAYTYVKDGYDIPMPGADRDPFAGEIGSAKNKANLNLAYKWGNFGVSTVFTYIGRSSLDDQFLADFDLPPHSVQVGSRTYTDLQLTYQLRKSTELYFGLNNAFDQKAPPIISGLPGDNTGTETDAGTYDPIGRRWYAGLRIKL